MSKWQGLIIFEPEFIQSMGVQNTIIRGIRESLHQHDYLVLPEFGGFVLKSRVAHFGSMGSSLLPPSRTISFNLQLKQDDGILAAWLSKELKCETAEALRQLKDFAAYCLGVLNTRRRISLDGIGFFFLDFENNICFEPQGDINYQRDSFGLEPLQLKPLAISEAAQDRRNFVFEDRPAAPALVNAPKRQFTLRRAIVPLVLILVLFALTGVLLNERKISGQLQAAFGGSAGTASYIPQKYCDLQLENSSLEPSAYIADANGIAVLSFSGRRQFSVKAGEVTVTDTSNDKGQFEIVVGCFSKVENAKKLIRQLSRKNVQAALGGKNEKGLYLVHAGRFQDRAQAVSRIEQLRTKHPHAWIRSLATN